MTVDLPVSCERPNALAVPGVARDLGIGGMFVESTELLLFGTDVIIVARLPGETIALRLPGVVRWTRPDGFGVQFGLLGARETHALAELLKY